MLSVVNHQASVSPAPSLEEVGKKKKSHTLTKHKPKSQGLEASGVPPKVTKGRIQENHLDRVSQLHQPFSLAELKAHNTLRVNRISQVTYRRACLMLALEGFSSSL
ncbi:hypothetical protein Tco_0877946 [Tanacetum coccineum]|uniref:Uncharacterized protein n=1 Tax=Tanacetum coccineum TaxID=301880 RepID=A0ABQ5BWH6_9ASTR